MPLRSDDDCSRSGLLIDRETGSANFEDEPVASCNPADRVEGFATEVRHQDRVIARGRCGAAGGRGRYCRQAGDGGCGGSFRRDLRSGFAGRSIGGRCRGRLRRFRHCRDHGFCDRRLRDRHGGFLRRPLRFLWLRQLSRPGRVTIPRRVSCPAATLANSGAATSPPPCANPFGSSSIATITSLGSSAGAAPMNHAV